MQVNPSEFGINFSFLEEVTFTKVTGFQYLMSCTPPSVCCSSSKKKKGFSCLNNFFQLIFCLPRH